MDRIKQRLKSKTYWTSLITFGVAIWGHYDPEISQVLANNILHVVVILGIFGIGNRELTNKPLSEK